MDGKPLTQADVHDVVFDKAPLGKRGYDEDQVDDFLDRIEATLAGKDTLTAEDVRAVVFEAAPLMKRGYHEDQVDAFLDTVVATLELRARAQRVAVPPRPHYPAEDTHPMPFTQPPSLPVVDTTPATQPVRHDPDDDLEAAPPGDILSLPLPPAPPGARGYRPGDVEKLAKLLAAAIERVDGPTSNDLARVKLSRTFFTGQGYHADVVDTLIDAWLWELRHREG
ncbi:MAG TPA: DivIVA domain-containing protein [Actinophytocola sp.]|uniref:DivIVA domain-containing protein n=1 Tax=Actinophytocola sp. TaxID=1872138 RepID=UPI002DDC9813|nr:DivIVA domain-containing protein [Actinophytocola sp.]HEV2778096.1 DivIVA domain-containing protein [Actinophytocola sp.]